MIADTKLKPVSDSRLPGFWITEQKYRYTILFIAESGKTTVGLNDLASSKSIMAYDMIITMSPTCTFLAAAPFRQIHPEPRSPLII